MKILVFQYNDKTDELIEIQDDHKTSSKDTRIKI